MSKYKITGVDRDGKRFRIFTNNRIHMIGINVWNGSKWEYNEETQRYKLLTRIYN